jgi:hypothetical protein
MIERRLRRSAVEPLLIRRRCDAEASLKVSMEVALVGEPCGGGGLGDGFAPLQHAAGYAYPVSDLQGVGGQAGSRKSR